ncbi:MAG: hypothetical protein AAFV53_24995, partial [Myxococcota bacterium]
PAAVPGQPPVHQLCGQVNQRLQGGCVLSGQSWFVIERGILWPRLPAPPAEDTAALEALVDLTAELVDWRLTRYRRRRATQRGREPAFIAAVRCARGTARLVVPRRRALRGEMIARLPEGAPWRLRFEEDVVAARPLLESDDQLMALLTRWFGPHAGDERYRHRVRFSPGADGWWMTPLGGAAPAFRARAEVRTISLPSVLSLSASYGAEDETAVRLPAPSAPTLIAARALNDEMNGGDAPIRAGDWLLLRPGRLPLGEAHGRVAVVLNGDGGPKLRRVVRAGERFRLRVDRPGGDDASAESDAVVVASLLAVVRPEELAPFEGALLEEGDLARVFGVSSAPDAAEPRVDGHRFLLVDQPGVLVAPDRIQALTEAADEVAYVLSRADGAGPWRYDGVARVDAADRWAFAGVHWQTWRTLGDGRAPQRTLPSRWFDAAEAFAERVGGEGGAVRLGEQSRTVAGRTRRGGVRLERAGQRLVSLTREDLGWVLWEAAQPAGGGLTTQRVCARRYLLGTPPAKQRREPTRWAIALWERSRGDEE